MADHVLPSTAAVPSTETTAAAAPPPRRPSLLPAFEPLSSSPGLPRPTKRKFDDLLDDRKYYPTPVPTSSTGILPSSPPAPTRSSTRPNLQRAVSTLSERAPLGKVPTVEIPATGEPHLLGRSSNSSDYQISSNRLISRVHLRVTYQPPHPRHHPAGKVVVECLGWNGVKVHCRGEIVELDKGECFASDDPLAQVMLDVQETRVMLAWPKEYEGSREPPSVESRSPGVLDEESPSKRRAVAAKSAHFPSSPPPMLLRSPHSSTPGAHHISSFTSTFRADRAEEEVKVYEDHESDADAPHDPTPSPLHHVSQSRQLSATPKPEPTHISRSPLSSEPDEFSEHDEENDPIVHSFGPYGENLLSRFQSIQSQSPEQNRKPLASSLKSPNNRSPSARVLINLSPVKNHVINQLAFSRIHSLPLSTIHSNLPDELRGVLAKPADVETRHALTVADLKNMLDGIPCVGEIAREGKDAAGKLLESEFYYVPEMDIDQMRKDTVTHSLGKTSIRAARKQHKQYYWKRPRH